MRSGQRPRYGPFVRGLSTRIGPLALDAALVFALSVWMEIEILWSESVAGPKFVTAPLFLLLTVPLLWRRRAPLLVAAVSMSVVIAHALATGNAPEGGPGFVAVLVLLYSLGAYVNTRRALVGLAVVVAAYVVHELNNPSIETEAQLWSALFAAAIAAIVFGLGTYIRRYRQSRELERRAARLEGEREERARAAVVEERARIARELHDIVSHNVSLMVVQAEAAEEVLRRQPERAEEPLRKIQRSGREALNEMRRMLGVLRSNGSEPSLAPQPGLERLGALVESVEGNGLSVTLRVEGQPKLLAAGVDLAAYRVVQEALTNTLRHAGASHVDVVVRYSDTEVELEIRDDGRGVGHLEEGHGLVGMRERIRVYGGQLEAGPRAKGGFSVRATLPLA
jgi:signal transduction histidine kinase